MKQTTLVLTVGVALFAACPATADVPFVERPLTLSPGQVSADIGIGVAQGENVPPSVPGRSISYLYGNQFGWGGSLETAVGIQYLGQLGLHVGYRGDDVGEYANADLFARLLDPVRAGIGGGTFAGPELDWRKTLLAPSILEVGVELRLLAATNEHLRFGLVYGVPVHVHLAPWLRLDMGVYLASRLTWPSDVGAEIPAQLFFQVGHTFFGPEVGVASGGPVLDDILVGVTAGHTFGGVVEVKVQVYTTDVRLFESSIGGGIGLGIRL